MPPPKQSFEEPGTDKESGWDARWENLRLAVLCIGVQAYPGHAALANTVRDADEMYKNVNMFHGCRAAILRDPKTKNEIYDAMRRKFLEPISKYPPQMVLLFYAGHGVQVDNSLFLIPARAEYSDVGDCKQACLSHLEVFAWFKTYVDTPAKDLSYTSGRPAVRFLQILDMCRDGFGTDSSHSCQFDPERHAAPELWSLCLSTSRGAVASDGDSHSPFIQELLNPAHGIFASNVPLKQGIERACRAMEKTTQRPVTIGLDRILPGFCLDKTPKDFNLLEDMSESCALGGMPVKSYHITNSTSISSVVVSSEEKSRPESTHSEEYAPKKRRLLEVMDEVCEGLGANSGVKRIWDEMYRVGLPVENEGLAKLPRKNAVFIEGVLQPAEDGISGAVISSILTKRDGGEQVQVCLCVMRDGHDPPINNTGFRIIPFVEEVEVWVCTKRVDLSAHEGLTELPDEVRKLHAQLREITIISRVLKTLPEWLGEMYCLEVLRVGTTQQGSFRFTFCPLQVLPESIGSLVNLRTLNLEGCYALTSLPESLGLLTKLRTLNLHGCNSLTLLPESLANLTGLEDLKMSHCIVPAVVMSLRGLKVVFKEVRLRINTNGVEEESVARVRADHVHLGMHGLTTLPEDMRNFKDDVLVICVQSDALEALPEWLGELHRLETLEVMSFWQTCPLQALPMSFNTLVGLRTFALWKCHALRSLPESIGSLQALQHILLSSCLGLIELPATLGNLTGLQSLTLQNLPIMKELPELSGLAGLRTLKLEDCVALTILPESLGSLPALQDMLLSGCHGLTGLPVTLGKLSTLETLMLFNLSRMKELPELSGLAALQTFQLHNCALLPAIPQSLGCLSALQIIVVSGCIGLTHLPQTLGNLTGLQSLILNDLTGVTELPNTLSALIGLQFLDIANISKLSVPAWVIGLSTLKFPFKEVRLRLRGAASGHCPEETGLVRLRVDKVFLSEDRLLALPEDLKDFKQEIQELVVFSANIVSLPDWLSELTGLQTVKLNTCELTTVTEGIGALTRLITLELESCTNVTVLPSSLGSMKGLLFLKLVQCHRLRSLPESIGKLTGLQTLDLAGCKNLSTLPESLGQMVGLCTLNLLWCYSLTALPQSLGQLTDLRMLHVCYTNLKELPSSLGKLTELHGLYLQGNDDMHTPPPTIINAGTPAVLQFLRDLAKGDAPCHLIKVVLFGDEKAGKSSLADSLVLGHPATRADNDRTVGIEVRRWRIGEDSQLVANIYDAAGQAVYRATLGFFMSAGALFLHVVRSDMSEDKAVATLLEWVEAVQQEAPGSVMVVVWTHIDCFTDCVCGGAEWYNGYLRVVDEDGANESWIVMLYLQQRGVPCKLKEVPVLVLARNLDSDLSKISLISMTRSERCERPPEDVKDRVVVCDFRKSLGTMTDTKTCTHGCAETTTEETKQICSALTDLQRRGALGVIAVVDCLNHNIYRGILASTCSSSLIPIMLIHAHSKGFLTQTDTTLTAFPDVESTLAMTMQSKVLLRVHEESERQVQAVDQALQEMENDMMLHLDSLQHMNLQHVDQCAKWKHMREQRDITLTVLDRQAMAGCSSRQAAGGLGGEDKQTLQIKEMAEALHKVKLIHGTMQEMEKQLPISQPIKNGESFALLLRRLRQQRVHRPRILFSHSVSSRTGQGLFKLRRGLKALMEDQRLFPDVWARVPLNYSMLERLAQQGRDGIGSHPDLLLFGGHASMVHLNMSKRTITFQEVSTFRSRQPCRLGDMGYYELQILEKQRISQYGFASRAFKRVVGFVGRDKLGFASNDQWGVGNNAASWAIDGSGSHSKLHDNEEYLFNRCRPKNTARLNQVFHALDRNGDGTLSLDYWKLILPFSDRSFDEIQSFENAFKAVDTDKDDKISEIEFFSIFRQLHGDDLDDLSPHAQTRVNSLLDEVITQLKHLYNCTWNQGDVVGLACDLQNMKMLVSVNGSFAPPNGLVFDLDPNDVRDGLFAAFTCQGGSLRFNLGEVPFKYDPPSVGYRAFIEFASALDEDTTSTLLWACYFGDVEVATKLIEPTILAGGLNCQHTARKITCLMAASEKGYLGIVEILLAAGARTELTDRHGMTALLLACANRHDNVAKILATPTHAASALDVCSTAFTGLVGDNGYSALMWAEELGLTDVVQILRACGAAALCRPSISLFRGDWEMVQLNLAERAVVFLGLFSTFRSKQRCAMGSKIYFEVQIFEPNELIFVGFASTSFERKLGKSMEGVGGKNERNASWSVNGTRQQKHHYMNATQGRWFNGTKYSYEYTWKQGDVVGLACDLQTMKILISVNGSFAPPNGLVFDLDPNDVRDGLFAALTGAMGTLGYNLGEVPFKYDPPSVGYRTFVEACVEEVSSQNSPWLAKFHGDIHTQAEMRKEDNHDEDLNIDVRVVDADLEDWVDGRAEWEMPVTKHVADRASARLRTLCGQAYVSLGELEEAASEVGMDRDEVHSALKFLHGTGSVLHYGLHTAHGSLQLQNTVFMQPQYIINAIKRIIREPNADKVNEELRQMDAIIRRSDQGRESLDRFLGTSEGYGSGVVTRQLLTQHLWRDFIRKDHEVLLQLMQAFKLLRPLAETKTYLVPAMLPKSELPTEYVTPYWWCPSKATLAAIMHVEQSVRRAEMRIMYKVLGGRLPFGFMSELQVSLAQTESVDPNEELHFAPEAAVVDRLSGSVLCAGYKCGNGSVREWVIVSRKRTRNEGKDGEASGHLTDSIRVMGWVELSSSSTKGATDWRLFKRIMQKIEDMEQSAPGLCVFRRWYCM